MATSCKRKRTVLSFERKLEILDKLKNKHTTSTGLAKEYDIGISTVCDLKKNEGKIRSFVATHDKQATSKRKTMKQAKDAALDKSGKSMVHVIIFVMSNITD